MITIALITCPLKVKIMFSIFLIPALLAGLGVAIATAPIGCFMVWRRMAYFGDATAHAAILGIAMSLALSTNMFLGILFVTLIMAFTVSSFTARGYAMDTLLGVMAHATLAVGLVVVSFIKGAEIDLHDYLFGDISAVTSTDLVIIWGGAISMLTLVAWRWSALLTATLNEDLAYASGINPKREQLILTLALAVVVAVAIKITGILLITAMLVIPAAAARPFSKTPEKMAVIATLIGAFSACAGIQISHIWGTPTGPTIVCVAALLFIASHGVRLTRQTG